MTVSNKKLSDPLKVSKFDVSLKNQALKHLNEWHTDWSDSKDIMHGEIFQP